MYRLLIADDERIEREVLFKILSRNLEGQCEIFQAGNGREALEIYREKKIQIAILDIEMPGINGIEAAEKIREVICSFGLDAKIVRRKNSYVVYLKEGSQIVDILNVMEAHVSLMELENVRILKEMRNSVNRKVNCETANINKTVSAAVKQVEDIKYLRDTVGFDHMPDNLVEAALARLENPDATLKELGASLDPPVGKSGINHRLRRLSEMADKVRQEQGGLL